MDTRKLTYFVAVSEQKNFTKAAEILRVAQPALGAQIRRAAYSVPANVVEGFGRYSPRDRSHFLEIALSSLAEVSYCVHVSLRLEYIDRNVKEELDTEIRRISAPLRALMQRSLAMRK